MSKQNKRREVRRWIVPGDKKEKKLLVALGRKRSKCVPIIIKAIDWVDKHLTWSVKEDGTFKLHMTKEGNVSEHTRLVKGRMDLEKLKRTAQKIYQKSAKPINPKNRLLGNFVVLLPKNLEAWNKFYWRLYEYKRRKIIYPDSTKLKEMERDIEDYFDVLYMDELSEPQSFLIGMYSDPEGKRFGILLSKDSNYYMMPINEMIEALVDSFIVESIWCPRCGVEVGLSTRLCPNCGQSFTEDQ